MANLNPLQIATQRWYPIGLAGNRIGVGLRPASLAFDGQHLWVANTGSANVTKIQASDGAVLGTFGVVGMPVALAFDGGSVWALTRASTTTRLVKLRASSGSVEAALTVAPPNPPLGNPVGLAFDGVCLWVGWSSPLGDCVRKVRVSDGAVLASVPTQGGSIADLAFDGECVWAANVDSRNVTRIRASDATFVGLTGAQVDASSLVFDGSAMWVGGSPLLAPFSLSKIRASDGALLDSFFPMVGGQSIEALALVFDGANIWAAGQGWVHKVRPADGAKLGSWAMPGLFLASAFDGGNVWLADYYGSAVVKV
jgi:hypothetical protein